MGYKYRDGQWESNGRLFMAREWNELHKDLRAAKAITRTFRYQQCKKVVEESAATIEGLHQKWCDTQEALQQLSIELQRKYQREDGRWKGITEDEQADWDSLKRTSKVLLQRKSNAERNAGLTIAKGIIAKYESNSHRGTVKSRAFYEPETQEFLAATAAKHTERLVKDSAHKISTHENLCWMGRNALSQAFVLHVVDELSILEGQERLVDTINRMGEQTARKVYTFLSGAHHDGCDRSGCSWEDNLRRLGEIFHKRELPAHPGDATQTPAPPQSGSGSGQRASSPIQLLETSVHSGRKESNGDTGLVDETSESDGISGISQSPGTGSDTEKSGDDGLGACGGIWSVFKFETLSEGNQRDAGGQSSGEGDGDGLEEILAIHDPHSKHREFPQISGGTVVPSGQKEPTGVPTSIEGTEHRGAVRHNNSSPVDSTHPESGGEAVTVGDGMSEGYDDKGKPLRDDGYLPVDSGIELDLSGSNQLTGAAVGDTRKSVRWGDHPPKQAPKGLLRNSSRLLERVPKADSDQDCYTRHMECSDTFRLLPQSTKESVRTRLGYYPTVCAHGTSVVALHSAKNRKPIGDLLTGDPRYSVIILSPSQAQNLLAGREITLRATFGSERLKNKGFRQSGKNERLDQRSKNDTIPKPKVQRDAGLLHPPNRNAGVQNQRRTREPYHSKGLQPKDEGRPPVASVATNRGPGRTQHGSNKVGSPLQQGPHRNPAHVLPGTHTRPNIPPPSHETTQDERGHGSWYQVQKRGRHNERRHDDRPRQLCTTCYNCLNVIQLNGEQIPRADMAPRRRWRRLRGDSSQILCNNCKQRARDAIHSSRAQAQGGGDNGRVSPNRVLPVEATQNRQRPRNGAIPTQGIGNSLYGGGQARTGRVSKPALARKSDTTPRTTYSGPNFPEFEPEISSRGKQNKDRNRVLSKTGRARNRQRSPDFQ